MRTEQLPSWRPGTARDSIIRYLAEIEKVPVEDRVAYLDNDGTLWCERPHFVQYDFFLDGLRRRSSADPTLSGQPEFAAVLNDDAAKVAELGLGRIAVALAQLYDGRTPREFAAAVDGFLDRYRHPQLGRSLSSIVYQPMIELMSELRAHDFTVGIVTGGGTEFVRQVSPHLYAVPPELVVGTSIGYEFGRDDLQRPRLRRLASLMGAANEGEAKVEHIQAQLGRAPILAVGNSAGDRELLEWAATGPVPGLAVLINHDDAEREYSYAGTAASFKESEPITAVATRLGWVTVSMARDWAKVFPDANQTKGDQAS